jgi:hypothetical protein
VRKQRDHQKNLALRSDRDFSRTMYSLRLGRETVQPPAGHAGWRDTLITPPPPPRVESGPPRSLTLFSFRPVCYSHPLPLRPPLQRGVHAPRHLSRFFHTALGMAKHLIILLNTIFGNLLEPEPREVRGALERSVYVADEPLYNIAISSTFETLTQRRCVCVTLSSYLNCKLRSERLGRKSKQEATANLLPTTSIACPT